MTNWHCRPHMWLQYPLPGDGPKTSVAQAEADVQCGEVQLGAKKDGQLSTQSVAEKAARVCVRAESKQTRGRPRARHERRFLAVGFSAPLGGARAQVSGSAAYRWRRVRWMSLLPFAATTWRRREAASRRGAPVARAASGCSAAVRVEWCSCAPIER